MQEYQLDAYLIPDSDPHSSEYLADHCQGRCWISGFTGTAGSVVITQDQAGLWTDGRYNIKPKNSWPVVELLCFEPLIQAYRTGISGYNKLTVSLQESVT
ncbi:aminopeptidase P family N-terminal domain-containing protein [Oceanospirillum beijerinckii]|uniref:aminopeptidase P family N-terminal domain-containing protein n=1 Tax=Oceanospirillum beijerinckii TaxID=64976 RepID=UPI001FE04725|nr:aminopeptidase P family N-terminal domain-containing protein [Oceanospirillum beijerinckii]